MSTTTKSAAAKADADAKKIAESPLTAEQVSAMNPLQIIAITDAVLDLTEKVLSLVNDAKKGGIITTEQQLAVQTKYASLKTRADGQFAGEHWRIAPPASVQQTPPAEFLQPGQPG